MNRTRTFEDDFVEALIGAGLLIAAYGLLSLMLGC